LVDWNRSDLAKAIVSGRIVLSDPLRRTNFSKGRPRGLVARTRARG
jgi:hypothetical protein